jgi:hypothetical protein
MVTCLGVLTIWLCMLTVLTSAQARSVSTVHHVSSVRWLYCVLVVPEQASQVCCGCCHMYMSITQPCTPETNCNASCQTAGTTIACKFLHCCRCCVHPASMRASGSDKSSETCAVLPVEWWHMSGPAPARLLTPAVCALAWHQQHAATVDNNCVVWW